MTAVSSDRIDRADHEAVVVPGDAAARTGGYAIDTVLVSIASFVVLGALALVHGPVFEVGGSASIADQVEIDRALFAIDTAFVTVLAGAYFAGSWLRSGATPGQRAFGLRVLPRGARSTITARSAVIRFVALGAPFWVAAGLTSGGLRLVLWALGLVWYVVLAASVAIGEPTTGLHDRLAGTMAIRELRPVVGASTDREPST